MESELLRAVSIASAPHTADPALVAQAHEYLQQLRANTHEAWQPAWNVFAARKPPSAGTSGAGELQHSSDVRMFALNLVQDFLENRVAQTSDPAAAVAWLQQEALAYVNDEFVNGQAEGGLSFLKNKVAQALSLLLVQSYSLPPPYTLLATLLALTRDAAGALSPASTDLVLRIMHDLSLTLGSDTTLRAVRSRERLARDGAVRDEIRAHNAQAIAQTLWAVVKESLSNVGSARWPGRSAVDITEMAVRVVGDYVSWTDISLMVTPETVQILYTLLQHSEPALRNAAADCLHEVGAKGMLPPDKIELLRALDLTTVVGSLEESTRDATDSGEPDNEFRERLAKLANANSMELARILEDTAVDAAVRAQADELLMRSLPLALTFLGDAYDEMAEIMQPCLTQVLTILKKTRRASPSAALDSIFSPDKRAFLASLLDVCLAKMRYDEDAEFLGGDDDYGPGDSDDEDAAHFILLRKSLQVMVQAIAVIDEELFTTRVQTLIHETLNACDAGLAGTGPTLTWQQVEVALFAAFWFGELILASTGQPKAGIVPTSFVVLPPGEAAKAKRAKGSAASYANAPLNCLGETMQHMVDSQVSAFPHAAVKLQFFECMVRYAAFFQARPQSIGAVLPPFLDERGLHHPRKGVRHRINYLFFRLINATRTVLSPEFVRGVLERIQDVLVIEAELPPVMEGEDPLERAVDVVGTIDSQLNLFEASGIMVASLRQSPETQVALLRAIVDPMLAQLQQAVQAYTAKRQDLRAVLQAHHLFLASSTLSKGFPDITPETQAADTSAWVVVFKDITEQVLAALGELSHFSIIREAARGAFSRMVATCGDVVLPYVPALLNALLSETQPQELVEVLSFVGLIASRYKATVRPVMDELLIVLVSRVFHFLNREVAGTDDAVERAELIRAYINLLSTLLSANLEGVLRSEKNQPQLEGILQSLVFYATSADVNTQRATFSVLNRLVAVWGGAPGITAAPSNLPAGAAREALPGFEQFIYETLVPLVFEAPSKATFDLADAQSQQVLLEIATLLRTVAEVRGSDEAASYLTTVYFPRVGCPADMGLEFAQSLAQPDVKQLRRALHSFIQKSRGG